MLKAGWGNIEMATKDWRRIVFYNDLIHFVKENGDNIRVKQIHIAGKRSGQWLVFGYGIKIKDKYFKNKSDALVYAKLFMEKH